MKTIARLKGASTLLTREWPDATTGEIKKIYWMELYFSDGVEEFVGELTVRPSRNIDGQLQVQAPDLQVGGVYTVQFELTTNVSKKEGSQERRFNKLNITKMAAL